MLPQGGASREREDFVKGYAYAGITIFTLYVNIATIIICFFMNILVFMFLWFYKLEQLLHLLDKCTLMLSL